MIYYVVFLGLMALENVREVLTVENIPSSINNLNKTKGKLSGEGHISGQIQRKFQRIGEAVQENEDKQIFNIRRRQDNSDATDDSYDYEDDDYKFIFDVSKAPFYAEVVVFQDRKNWQPCGATIVNSCHVLTTARCVTIRNDYDPETYFRTYDLNMISVFTGSREYNKDDNVAKGLWIHPQYHLSKTEWSKDLAVVRTKVMTFSDKMQMVPIHPLLRVSDYSKIKNCLVTDFDAKNTNFRIQMEKATILSQKVCKAATESIKTAVDVNFDICVQVDRKLDAVDFGSPLICEGMLLGMLSWGTRVTDDLGLNFFGRLDNEQDFIEPIFDEVECEAASFSPTLTTLLLNVILLHFT